MTDYFEILRHNLFDKSEKVGEYICWRGGVGRDVYGTMRGGWPVEGSKVEKVLRVALIVEMTR